MKAAIIISITKKLMALAMSIFSIFSCAGEPAAPEQTQTADGADVRVVQFNLRCTGAGETSIAYRAPLMVAELKAIGADSMGFQEANLRWMTYLEDNLPEYAHVGVTRNKNGITGECSPVFYLKDKYNLIDSGTIWLSDTPDVPGSKYPYSQNIRICTWAVLENKETGKSYCHLNTHLDHISSKARENQMKVLLSKVNEYIGDYPIVLTGDFNDKEGSGMYELACSVLNDSRKIALSTDDKGTFHNYSNSLTTPIIDYVFVSESVTPLVYHVIDDKIDDTFLSDHYGIYVDLKF